MALTNGQAIRGSTEHDFDQLPSLTRKTAAEFEHDDMRLLERVRQQMFDARVFEVITNANAQSWARDLFESVRYGSRALAHAIFLAARPPISRIF